MSMSRYLWVEDFGQKDVKPWKMTEIVFGGVVDLSGANKEFRREEMVDFLRPHGVELLFDLQSAVNFISDSNELESIDFIVLDIDLPPWDDKGPDELTITLLRDWYEGIENDPLSVKDAIKQVAGYHLWTLLVIDKGFPKDRIQYCSDHADQLKSIHQSFEAAKLNHPTIYAKTDKGMKDWLSQAKNQQYVHFRRSFIDLVEELEKTPLPLCFSKLNWKDGWNAWGWEDASDYLGVLRRLLPANVLDEEHQKVALRVFLFALVQPWDAFVPRSEKSIFWGDQASRVLKYVRNILAHDKDAMRELKVSDAAFFVLLALGALFGVGSVKAWEKFSTLTEASSESLPDLDRHSILLKINQQFPERCYSNPHYVSQYIYQVVGIGNKPSPESLMALLYLEFYCDYLGNRRNVDKSPVLDSFSSFAWACGRQYLEPYL